MAMTPSLTRTQEAQAALERIDDAGARLFAEMVLALVVQRAFGERRVETGMEVDAYFLVKVFEEYFSDRDAIYKALAMGEGAAIRRDE